MLVRVRSQIPAIEAALRARGCRSRWSASAGCWTLPRSATWCARCGCSPIRPTVAALLRLLTGARWRIGPRDLVALHRRARAIAAARRGLPRRADAEPEIAPDRLDEATLVEALADLGPPQAYSAEGYARLRAYGRELALLRHRLDQPLPDLVADVERTIGLDVEVAVRAGVRPATPGWPAATSTRSATWPPGSPGTPTGATLSAFLAYLAAAEDEERGLTPGEVDVVEGAVQILTAHAAKGLEWDVVAVAGLTARRVARVGARFRPLPDGPGRAAVPAARRPAGLPRLALDAATDQKAMVDALQGFRRAVAAPRRAGGAPAGVRRGDPAPPAAAVLRLLVGEGVRRPRGPSVFLLEMHERCLDGNGVVDVWTPPPAADAENPTSAELARAEWPADPLGERRTAMAQAAALVRQSLEELGDSRVHSGRLDPTVPRSREDELADEAARWRHEADLLLAERDRLADRDGPVPVALPGHLSVSQLVALRRDPEALARALRRPMPARPDPYARRGTAFHAWLEQRFGADRLLDVDELPGAADDGRRARRRAGRTAGAVPGQRVGRPYAGGGGGAVRHRGRRRGGPGPDGRGVRRARWPLSTWSTGRPAASRPAPRRPRRRCSWPRTGWPGRSWPACRSTGCGRPSTTCATGVTVRPADLLDADGLTALVAGVPEAAG